MTEDVLKWIRKEKLINQGDRVIAGVSGGADSVCLLLLLMEIREKIGFSLQAVHIEHGIRGEESMEDARFVESLCQRYGILCRIYRFNVPEYANEHKIGLEEAARMIRYRCYKKEADEISSSGIKGTRAANSIGKKGVDEGGGISVKIALAHHADDNAETLLFQMIRGSGLNGLGGMRLRRPLTPESEIIRPLLEHTRAEIEGYLKEKGQSFRTDSSNVDTGYSRNRIRHEVLPQMEMVNRQAVSHLNQSAGLLREAADYLKEQAEGAIQSACVWKENGCIILQELFQKYPGIIQREVLHMVLGKVAGSSRDIARIHVVSVMELWEKQNGRKVGLPYKMCAERIYEGIRITQENRGFNGPVRREGTEAILITAEELGRAETGEVLSFVIPNGVIRIRIIQFYGKMDEIPKKKYTKWLDYGKIKCDLQIRKRKAGDYLAIDENSHTKKLKEYFINEKIPQKQRDEMWLITEGSHVLWAAGGRMSAVYKVRENTVRVLEVQITGGNYHED